MTDAHDEVKVSLLELAIATANLDKDLQSVDSLTVQEAAEDLSLLKELIFNLRQLEAALERWVAECFKAEGWRDPQEFPGLGVVEVRRSTTRRKWEHDLLTRDWLNTFLEGVGGETPDPFDVVEEFRKVASVGGWKVRGLAAYGIEANDYCDTEPGTPTVSIVRAEK